MMDNNTPVSGPRGESGRPSWRRVAGFMLRWLVPLAFTVLLVWYMFRKVDFADMMRLLRHGVDYWWILAAMGLSVLSHVARAARWRLQLTGLGVRVPFMALCCSIFGCYALNLIFPRLGELWRCTYVSKVGKAHFTSVFGSMMADRLSDTVTVALLTLMTFILATPAINSFLERYPVGRDVVGLLSDPWTWLVLILAVGVLGAAVILTRRTSPMRRLFGWCREMWQGFAVLWHMRGRGRFLLLTGCIWGCYFIQLYVAFFAFPFTRRLCAEPELAFGLLPCLVAWIISSIGMAIPSNGGLGPWNLGIIFGLAIYGVGEAEGTAFSMLQWSGQTVMLILLGIYTMAYIALTRHGSGHGDPGVKARISPPEG